MSSFAGQLSATRGSVSAAEWVYQNDLRRRISVCLGLLGAGVRAHGQSAPPWRLAWLSPSDGLGPNHKAFLARMQQLGYEQDRHFSIEWAWVGSNTAALSAFASRLVDARPDLIIAQSQVCAQAAQAATRSIPIVFVGVRDAVAAGLVKSYASPGGNLTGVTLTTSDELVAKLLELLRELMPTARRLGVFWNPGVPIQGPLVETLVAKGKGMSFAVRPVPIKGPGDIERGFEVLTRESTDALLTLVEWFSLNNRDLIARLAIQNRLPTLFEIKDYVLAGGLLAYGVVYHEHYASAADYVDKILRGSKPSDLPVQQPSRLEMVLNRKTARSIGLPLPKGILVRADQVID